MFRNADRLSRLAVAEHREVRNHMALPHLTVNEVLKWSGEFKAATGNWPTVDSGNITDTDETWLGIDKALRKGVRGLAGVSSLVFLIYLFSRVVLICCCQPAQFWANVLTGRCSSQATVVHRPL